MKKYSIGLYSTQITKNEALKAAESTKNALIKNTFEDMIADLCLQDTDPQVKWSFETPQEAGMAMNHSMRLDTYKTPSGSVLEVSCVMIEEYEEDPEDGMYLDGGDYDYSFKATPEQISEFNEFIGKEMF